MRVQMLSTQWAAADESGATARRYMAGGVYDPPPLVAAAFLELGFAELAEEPRAAPGPSETMEAGPSEVQEEKPRGRFGRKRNSKK
jgi:hypothetical protein